MTDKYTTCPEQLEVCMLEETLPPPSQMSLLSQFIRQYRLRGVD